MPRPFDELAKTRFVNLIKRGRMPRQAAEDIGFSWSTISSHLRSDGDFAEACREATLIVDERVEEILLDKAQEGDLGAIKYWLGSRQPEKWAERKQVQVTGAGGGPIQVAVGSTDGLRQMLTSPDSRDQMLAMLPQIPAIGGFTDVESEEVEPGG